MRPPAQPPTLKLIRSYWQQASKTWHYPAYERPYNWLIYTASGAGEVALDDYSIQLQPQTLTLIPLNRRCHYSCSQEMQIAACAFTLELPSGLDNFQLYEPPHKAISFDQSHLLSKVIDNQQSPTAHFEAMAAMYNMLALIMAQSTLNSKTKTADIRLQKILIHIEKNLNQALSIPQLALIHGTSVEHFSRWFKTMTNLSPNKYISLKRIKKACKLLMTSHKNIETIGFECGFQDPLYFSKCFKKRIGIPPSDYRRSQDQDPFTGH